MEKDEKKNSRFANRKTISLAHGELITSVLKDRVKSSSTPTTESKIIEAILLGQQEPLFPFEERRKKPVISMAYRIAHEYYMEDNAVTQMLRVGFNLLAATKITDTQRLRNTKIIPAMCSLLPYAKQLPIDAISQSRKNTLKKRFEIWLNILDEVQSEKNIPTEMKEDLNYIGTGRLFYMHLNDSPEKVDYQRIIQYICDGMTYERNVHIGFGMLSELMYYFEFPNTPGDRALVLNALCEDLEGTA